MKSIKIGKHEHPICMKCKKMIQDGDSVMICEDHDEHIIHQKCYAN